jgi:hypothetical protein
MELNKKKADLNRDGQLSGYEKKEVWLFKSQWLLTNPYVNQQIKSLWE